MKKNANLMVGWKSVYLIFVLVFLLLGLILYFAPAVFLFLFSSILGNLLLVVGVVLLGFFDMAFAFGVALIFVVLFLVFRLQKSGVTTKEKFLSGVPQYQTGRVSVGSWPPEIVREFLDFQAAHNPNIFFDMDLIQKQATPEEARTFLKNGSWPWSAEVQRMYRDAIAENSYISTNPGSSLDDAQMVYNENAIKQLLSWNSKEGDFLLGGVIIGHPKGMPKNINNTVRCVASVNGDAVLEKTIYTGYNGINGTMAYKKSVVPNGELPNIVPGFAYLKGVCNPCAPLNSPPDYSCPFIIDTGNGTEISDIWEKLWGITGVKDEKKNVFATRDNSYLLGISRKDSDLEDSIVLNMNTNFF
uniref:Uncharacterized protein n=1 Tax=viral metagenome TaxID=1070528 RepID=A0A6C0LD30_9ZZZZ